MKVRDSAVERTAGFEGFVEHFYLDSKGKVTLGYGRMVADADAAAALPMKDGGRDAADKAKRDEWALIKSKPAGHPASYYKQFTKLTIPMDKAKALLRSDLEGAAADLKIRFSKLDDYPEDAQDALLDMMFNLGLTRFTRAKWPGLFAAVEKQDWKAAAAESNRPDVQPARNAAIRALFSSAAEKYFGIEVLAGTVDRSFGEQLAELQKFIAAGQDLQKFFPGRITRVCLKIRTGNAEMEFEMSGPERAKPPARSSRRTVK